MEDDLSGLPDFHFLLHLQYPPRNDFIGVPEFVALLDEDYERAHGEANIENSSYVFEEAMPVKSFSRGDFSLINGILKAEREAGVRWAE